MFCQDCGQCLPENIDIKLVVSTTKVTYEVTPTGRHALSYDEESWRERDETSTAAVAAKPDDDFSRRNETRKSKTKRVKNYLKRCKNAIGNRTSSNDPGGGTGGDVDGFVDGYGSAASYNLPPSTVERRHSPAKRRTSSSSWYIDRAIEINECEVNELDDVYEEAHVWDPSKSPSAANLVEYKRPASEYYDNAIDACRDRDGLESVASSSLNDAVPRELGDGGRGADEETEEEAASAVISARCGGESGQESSRVVETKNAVEVLVDKYFGDVYSNYTETKRCLVRQARDLLVCEYRGCLTDFEREFCVPAAKLLRHIKNDYSSNACLPSGWPLSLGRNGVIVNLGPLPSSYVKNNELYVCVRCRSAPGLEVAVLWKRRGRIGLRTLAEFEEPLATSDRVASVDLSTVMDLERCCAYADEDDDVADERDDATMAAMAEDDDCYGDNLPELLQNLLVSVEHAIERVPLDDIAFPCPQCAHYVPLDASSQSKDADDCPSCSCRCPCSNRQQQDAMRKKDSSMQTSPMFEFVGSIPHIDSDEDDDVESIKSGSSSTRRTSEIVRPRRIGELPEKLLMSGINLPGTVDIDGRPIILCYAECIARAGLNKYEVAKLLLYYSTVPSYAESEKGFTILLLSEADVDNKVLELLDKAALLVTNQMKIKRFLLWKPIISKDQKNFTNRTQAVVIGDEATLKHYVEADQAPSSCGGSCTHDQLEWVEFFKQLEPFLASCRVTGRLLLAALCQLRTDDVPRQVTRRFLNHQCRQIAKTLQLDSVQKLRREGPDILASLDERKEWLANSRHVVRLAKHASDSFRVQERVAQRMEQLAQERKERLRELARLRTLQEEADKLIHWIRSDGEHTSNELSVALRMAESSTSVKDVEKRFEAFYFNAMRQIDKSTDIIDESNEIPEGKASNVKESTNNLKVVLREFTDKLEDQRERIEDTARCYDFVESAHGDDEGEEKSKRSSGQFRRVAAKSENEKLMRLFKAKEPNDQGPPDRDKSLSNRTKTKHSTASSSSSSSSTTSSSSATLTTPITSTPIKSQTPSTQIRRRSVSSLAFIYKCNHHAAGVSCNCCESDTENTVSYKLKKKYMQTLQNCNCHNNAIDPNTAGSTATTTTTTTTTSAVIVNSASAKDTLERKTSVTLDGIKEVRESVEDLLEKNEETAEDGGEMAKCGGCDSGVSSTADNSVGEESSVYKKKLERTCSCQYYRESGGCCAACSSTSSSTGSNQDHTENQQDSIIEDGSDGFIKSSSEDIEDEHYNRERRKMTPVSVNSHLYCHSSSLELTSDAFDSSTDPKIQKNLLLTMREMIQTERDYVKSLDFVIENYIPELLREDIPQALRGQRNVIFGNVEKIYEFHSQHFLRELEQFEHNPLQVGQIFLKHQKSFYLYALYNKNKPKSDSLMSENGTQFFRKKQMELKDNMDLASYLLKPVQRMGKYALLLQKMMKDCLPLQQQENCNERLSAELEDLKLAELMVKFQLRHGNDLLAMDSIRECDVNLKEQGRLLRQNEFLVWERRNGKKSLRQVFLFEDLILFSKARRFPDRKNLDLYMYKNSIKMTDIGLTAKIGDSLTKFEIWFRKLKPNDTFTLQANTEEVKKAWTEEISQLLWKQALKNREVRMAEMSSMGIGNKPCLDIRPSADQINDRSISLMQLSRTAPRFRNSIVGITSELRTAVVKRPHSVISMSSSVSSGSTSSAGSTGTTSSPNTLIAFDSSMNESSRQQRSSSLLRSGTLNSQCSIESGIIADMSTIGSDDCHSEITVQNSTHWPLEKSNSQHSNISIKSGPNNLNNNNQTTLQHEETTQQEYNFINHNVPGE